MRMRALAASRAPGRLRIHQKLFKVSLEERDQVLRVLAEAGQEAIGSMGDDTPLRGAVAAGALAVRLFPPAVRPGHQSADRPPARADRDVAGDLLRTRAQPVRRRPKHAARLVVTSPVLSGSRFDQLLEQTDPRYAHERIDLNYHRQAGPAGGHRGGVRPGRRAGAGRQDHPGAVGPRHRPGPAADPRPARDRRGASAADRRACAATPTSWWRPPPPAIRIISPC